MDRKRQRPTNQQKNPDSVKAKLEKNQQITQQMAQQNKRQSISKTLYLIAMIS